SWELHAIGLAIRRKTGGHACGVIETGSIGRSPRTSHEATKHGAVKRRSDLNRVLGGYRMGLICREFSMDNVCGMNPKLIRQKGQSLISQITTLSTHRRLPVFGLSSRRDDFGH